MQLEFPVDLSFEGDCTRHSHPRVLSTGASPIPFLTGPIYLAFDESAFSASLSQGLLTDLLWFQFLVEKQDPCTVEKRRAFRIRFH